MRKRFSSVRFAWWIGFTVVASVCLGWRVLIPIAVLLLVGWTTGSPGSSRVVLIGVAVAAAANLITFTEPRVGDVVGNVTTGAIALVAGWLIVRRAGAGLPMAALAGVLVIVVDLLLITAAVVVIFHPTPVERQNVIGLAVVLGMSLLTFAPAGAMLGLIGGLAARRGSARESFPTRRA